MSQIEAVEPAATCPFAVAAIAPARSRSDVLARRILRIDATPAEQPSRSASNVFTRSMLISTIRCSLTYLVLPFLLPALGLVSGAGVVVGAIIGVVAIVFNVMTMRRLFAADHRWRWSYSAVCFVVASLLLVLLVQDVALLVG